MNCLLKSTAVKMQVNADLDKENISVGYMYEYINFREMYK